MPVLYPITSGPAAGYYASQADVEARFGTTNVAVWSQLDPVDASATPTANVSNVQQWLTFADAEVNDFFHDGPFTVPLPVTPVTTDWAATIAGVRMYQSRDHLLEDPQAQSYRDKLASVYRNMGLYKGDVRRAHPAWPRRWPASSAPSSGMPFGM